MQIRNLLVTLQEPVVLFVQWKTLLRHVRTGVVDVEVVMVRARRGEMCSCVATCRLR